MVLVHNGKEKRYAKDLDNKTTEGDFEFFIVKAKDLKDPSKTKEVTITPEHIILLSMRKKRLNYCLPKI